MTVWSWSGEVLNSDHDLLSLLNYGIGSGGQAFNNLRAWELTFSYCLDATLEGRIYRSGAHCSARQSIMGSIDALGDLHTAHRLGAFMCGVPKRALHRRSRKNARRIFQCCCILADQPISLKTKQAAWL